MALSAATIMEVRSTATSGNVNGGGFNPTNANGLTDGAISSPSTSSPVLSSVSYSFAAGDVGAWVYFPTQSNITSGWYQIASVATGAATLSAAVGQAVQVSNNRFQANTVAGCGSATSGVTFLVDYSQQNAAQAAFTNLGSASGSTTLTDNSAGGLFTKVMVGNLIHITAGTNATAGWYEIVSWTDANNVVLDRTPHGANTMSATTGKVGGAISLGATGTGIGDNSFFSSISAAQIANGGRYFIKNGSYSLGESSTAGSGGIFIEGYNSFRGDRPTDSTRPTFSNAAFVLTASAGWLGWCILNGTGTQVVSATSGNTRVFYCKITNISSTSGGTAIDTAGQVFFCELVSYRGYGLQCNSSGQPFAYGCYIHDCTNGVELSAAKQGTLHSCIIAGCTTCGVDVSNASATNISVINCTIYGAENKLGIGVQAVSGVKGVNLFNSIIYGCATGVSNADTTSENLDDFNNYYNNTADVSAATQWQKGANDVAVNPQFSGVAQITGSTATTAAGNHLVQTGATFITSGVVAGRDFLHVKSGTGVTAGIYGISSVDSETQITTDIAITANATADKVWQITTGRNFSVGASVKNLAAPSTYPGALTTSRVDIGAVQVAAPNYPIFGPQIIQAVN